MSGFLKSRVRADRRLIGDRFQLLVLALLFLSSVSQVSLVGIVVMPALGDGKTSVECGDCCGADCRCTGGCCADSHVVVKKPGSSGTDRRGSIVSGTIEMRRQNDCRSGRLLTTSTAPFQPFLGDGKGERLLAQVPRALQSVATEWCWPRPAVSQPNPRGPPLVTA